MSAARFLRAYLQRKMYAHTAGKPPAQQLKQQRTNKQQAITNRFFFCTSSRCFGASYPSSSWDVIIMRGSALPNSQATARAGEERYGAGTPPAAA